MKTIRQFTDADREALQIEQSFVIGGFRLPVRITSRIVFHWNNVVSKYCWRVSGWSSGNGYANIRVRNKIWKVHRVVYELCIGPIPAGHVLDHKKDVCRYRDCCNPHHLEPVPDLENIIRGKAIMYKRDDEYV